MDWKEKAIEQQKQIKALETELASTRGAMERLSKNPAIRDIVEGKHNPVVQAAVAERDAVSDSMNRVARHSFGLDGDTQDGVDMVADQKRPTLTVRVSRPRIETGADTDESRLAELIADGFFDKPQTISTVCVEFQNRGWGGWGNGGGGGGTKMRGLLVKFATWGFVYFENKWVKLRPGMEKRIKVVEIA